MKDKRSEIGESLILPCSQPSRLLVTLFLRLSARARICRLLSGVYHKRHHKNRTTRSLRILQKKMRFVLMELWKNSCDAHAKNHSIYVAPGDEISYYVHDDGEGNEASSSSQKAKTFFGYFGGFGQFERLIQSGRFGIEHTRFSPDNTGTTVVLIDKMRTREDPV